MTNITQDIDRIHAVELRRARDGKVRYWGGRRRPLVRSLEQAARVSEVEGLFIARRISETRKYAASVVPAEAAVTA